jgi:SAM-dependent methyltransferase
MSSNRSWFAIDGALEPIDLPGDTNCRFPLEVAEYVIERFSQPNDWVFDPFCGFGTTLVVAERLGRNAVGTEIDEARVAFAASRLRKPSRMTHGGCEELQPGTWPAFNLVLTSPPYGSFRDGSVIDSAEEYVAGATRIFRHIGNLLAPNAVIAVEVAQERDGSQTRPVVWRIGDALSGLFTFEDDIVRVNTGDAPASHGYQHSHILVFRN